MTDNFIDVNENCPTGIKNRARIQALEKTVDKVQSAIEDIRDRLLGRPSWVVLFLLTVMSSTIVGLLSMVLHSTGK